MKERPCANCGKERESKQVKYCLECWRDVPHESHLKFRKEYAKKYPKRRRAASLSRYYKDRVKTLYECPCETEKKINHHFDYDRPYEVIKLCRSCHKKEHIRLG